MQFLQSTNSAFNVWSPNFGPNFLNTRRLSWIGWAWQILWITYDPGSSLCTKISNTYEYNLIFLWWHLQRVLLKSFLAYQNTRLSFDCQHVLVWFSKEYKCKWMWSEFDQNNDSPYTTVSKYGKDLLCFALEYAYFCGGLLFAALVNQAKNGLIVYNIQNIFPLNLRFQSFSTHIDISQLKENIWSLSASMWSMYVWSCYALKLTTELCEGDCRNTSWTEVVCLKAEILLQNFTSRFFLSGEIPQKLLSIL